MRLRLRNLARRWWDLLRAMVLDFIEDDGLFAAAAIAFYAFLSLFPLLLLVLSGLGYLLSIPWIQEQVQRAFSLAATGGPAPRDALAYTMRLYHELLPHHSQWLESEFQVMVENWRPHLIIGLMVMLWSGRQVFLAMELSLHRAWRMPLRRSWLKRNLVCLGLIFLCGGVALVGLVLSVVLAVVKGLLDRVPVPTILGFTPDTAMMWSWFTTWLLGPLNVFLVFLILYRLLPSRRIPLSYAIPGALFSAGAWKILGVFYVEYARRFGQTSALYGSIWSVVGLLLWLYLMAVVFLLGAELVYAYTHRRGSQSPPDGEGP
ncbi:MAG TPA: YihY/virulence factor BrkB family protein [Candidatus Nitrosotenuis sp.]|jgi:membrane protein|nr:YihY/virulence factor BrkB family protein [Candidatus Nitrosotenuis sp.]